MKLFDSYVIKDLLKAFLAGVSVSIVLLVANAFFIYLKLITESNVDLDLVLKLFLYQIPSWIILSFPMGFLFSSLLTMGRLSRDLEMTALQSCGTNFLRIAYPTIIASIIVSVFAFYVNEVLVPNSNFQSKLIYISIAENPKTIPVKERVFFEGSKDRSIYVEKVDKKTGEFSNVLVFDSTKADKSIFPSIITANSGKRKKDKLLLYKGNMKQYNKTGNLAYESNFDEMEAEVDLAKQIYPKNKGITELSIREAQPFIKELEDKVKKGDKTTTDLNENKVLYYTKFSLPLATFFTSLIAIPIGIRFAKRSVFVGLSICIVIVFLWNLSFEVCISLGKEGALNPILSAWVQNIIFAVVGSLMLLNLSRK